MENPVLSQYAEICATTTRCRGDRERKSREANQQQGDLCRLNVKQQGVVERHKKIPFRIEEPFGKNSGLGVLP
jgi:hypothetical protein